MSAQISLAVKSFFSPTFEDCSDYKSIPLWVRLSTGGYGLILWQITFWFLAYSLSAFIPVVNDRGEKHNIMVAIAITSILFCVIFSYSFMKIYKEKIIKFREVFLVGYKKSLWLFFPWYLCFSVIMYVVFLPQDLQSAAEEKAFAAAVVSKDSVSCISVGKKAQKCLDLKKNQEEISFVVYSANEGPVLLPVDGYAAPQLRNLCVVVYRRVLDGDKLPTKTVNYSKGSCHNESVKIGQVRTFKYSDLVSD